MASKQRAQPLILGTQKKILWVFALSIILATLLVTLFLRSTLATKSLQAEQTHQLRLAKSLAHQYEEKISLRLQSLSMLAKTPAFAQLTHLDRTDHAIKGIPEESEPEKRRLLRQLTGPEGLFSALFLWQKSGDSYLVEPFKVQKALNRANFADRPYFQAVKRTLKPYISDGFRAASGRLVVVINVPVLDPQGDLSAHLGGVFYLDKLSRLLDASSLGPFGSGFLVDGKGDLIAHTDPEELAPDSRQAYRAHPMLETSTVVPAKIPAPSKVFRNPRNGKQYLGTRVPLRWDWQLVLASDMEQINAQHLPGIMKISILVAQMLILTGAIGLFASWRISRRWAASEAALFESEARFRHIYRHSPVMMHSIDEDGLICNVNEKWLEVTGYRREEVIGQKADFLMTAESSEKAFREVIPRFWRDGLVRDIEYQYLKKDGNRIDVLLNCDSTIDPAGKKISLSVVQDVTEQKKVAAALHQAKQELEERVAKRTAALRHANEGLLAQISEKEKVQEKLRTAAITDEMTGLLNRRGFFNLANHHLKVARREDRDLVLCYCDLDGLKMINDRLGHAAGDNAIIDAAKVLQTTFRQSDILARIGGDEFAVLATSGEEEDEKALASRLETNIREFNSSRQRPYNLSISLGLLRKSSNQAATIDDLLGQADRRMYQHKQEKKERESKTANQMTADQASGRLF